MKVGVEGKQAAGLKRWTALKWSGMADPATQPSESKGESEV